MRNAILTSILSVSAGLSAQGAPPAPSPFVVHEWGTFTSMQGSDGAGLEGLHHEEEGLPDFVHDLARLDATPQGVRLRRAMKLAARSVTQKMETPVLYFHTDVPRRVSVAVGFQRGVLTQFYPMPAGIEAPMLPPGGSIDMASVRYTAASWDLQLTPFAQPRPEGIPEVAAEDPWSFARQVRAAYVQTVPEKGGPAAEAEHYVFYRGLGAFTLPVKVRAQPGGRGKFRNGCGGDIPFAVAVEMGPEGGRFQLLGAVAPSATASIALGDRPFDPDLERVSRELGATVQAALAQTGLHLDEARAMVATWARQWFRSFGTRVIYLVPTAQIERILPLRIDPAPDRLVRVLVGRLEYVTPEMEQRVEQALRADDEAFLASLGRFLEPQVRGVRSRTADPVVRAAAERVLAALAP